MEFEQMIRLIDHVADKGLKTFCYENGDVRLSIEGKSCAAAAAEMPAAKAALQETFSKTAAPAQEAEGQEEAPAGKIVKSPLVGTFYTAPAEDAAPFVRVGDRVKKGQVLAIVEAMKLMNDIESEFDGEIAEICVENASAVEYGQPLFRIV